MLAMQTARENVPYLPDVSLPASLELTSDPERAFADATIVVSAVPSRYTRTMWEEFAGDLDAGTHLVSATKGIEEHSGLRMSEVLEQSAGTVGSISSISGPSFARELADCHPTAVTLGCTDLDAARTVQEAFSAGPLRVYRNHDLIGVEMGGALKNVIAIAAGIVEGIGFGSNTQAALISRGLKEVTTLAVACGAQAATLTGLAGLGDLVLPCTGPLSRNRGVGVEIGRGRTLDQITNSMQMVAEGVVTTRSSLELARRLGVEMPIAEGVHAVLYEGLDPRAGIDQLLARALVEEWES
jgi:glycerol-3-phosphate dehydrogenase (NAD(P)+)